MDIKLNSVLLSESEEDILYSEIVSLSKHN